MPRIQRMETSKDIARGDAELLTKPIAAFDKAGIEFIAERAVSKGGGRGVRFKAPAARIDGSGSSVSTGAGSA